MFGPFSLPWCSYASRFEHPPNALQRAATQALPFLGKFRRKYVLCLNPATRDDPHAPAVLLVG